MMDPDGSRVSSSLPFAVAKLDFAVTFTFTLTVMRKACSAELPIFISDCKSTY